MKVHYDRENKSLETQAKNVKDMLKELKITKNSVIIVVNDTLVTEDYSFEKTDRVQILSVVSGG